MGFEKREAKKAEERYKTQLAALQSERDALRSALAAQTRHDTVNVSDYEWHVELAAKGLAQRDNYPMPPSVTTHEGFYEVMAGAALDATGFRALLERVTRAEQQLEHIQEALRQADARAQNARHRAMTDESDSFEASVASIPVMTSADARPQARPPTTAQASETPATKGMLGLSAARRRLKRTTSR
jgi:DNA repair exonuclease SbcCD ATPase subunit